MIYKKRYGQPFDTESVVGSSLPMMETIPYLTKEPDGFSYAMEPQDVLYGLGENVRGINKRGWVYESKCSDDGNHTEGKSSLYGCLLYTSTLQTNRRSASGTGASTSLMGRTR